MIIARSQASGLLFGYRNLKIAHAGTAGLGPQAPLVLAGALATGGPWAVHAREVPPGVALGPSGVEGPADRASRGREAGCAWVASHATFCRDLQRSGP